MNEPTPKEVVRVERWVSVERRGDLPPVVEVPREDTAAPGGLIAGTPEAAAEKVNMTSHVEGRPALIEAKDGPARMGMEIVLAVFVVLLASVGVGVWFGAWAGLAAVAVGFVGLAFNPVIGAMTMRMQDRAEAARRGGDQNESLRR